jgi:hypothetical protein
MTSIIYHQCEAKDCKSQLSLGDIIMNMLFREFIQQNIEKLEIPFQPDEKRKYPPKVWEVLHKSLLVNQLQHEMRAETTTSLINSVFGGDDLGGLTLDNVIDSWLDSMTKTMNHIIGSALGNSKINQVYEKLVTRREVECSDAHNEVEDQLVKKGIELPIHTHTVNVIEVTDDNREQFDEFVILVLQNFDSETYGELPEEYSKARASDIEAMITELKDLVGDGEKADLVRSLTSDDSLDSGDFV